MKYNNLIAVTALLSSCTAITLKSSFIDDVDLMQDSDMSLNQRKLYAYSLK